MKPRWRVVAVVLLAASLAAAFSTALAYQIEQAKQTRGYPPNVTHLAALNATFWYGWVLLSAPLVWLANRVRIDRRPRFAVPIHVVTILLASFTHVALQTTAQTWVSRSKDDAVAKAAWWADWLQLYPMQLNMLIDWELITGAAIVGIAHAFFYYRESQRRAIVAAQLETRLVAAQLQALRSQLHPHFLFNTLHAISALMHRDVRAADRMLVQLSDLLRMTLDSVAHPEIRLNEEMEFLEKYLQIEQVRLGDRLTVKFDVDVNVLDAVVPALILQPLVENAIKHGIAPLGRPGQVSVGARSEGESLVMTVSDTGPGPNEPGMAALTTGIGVSNTRSRLKHQFGAHFRFEFHRHRDGFTVLVAIPLKHDPVLASTTNVA
jgi:two-component system, LytTR family, sensor kinase